MVSTFTLAASANCPIDRTSMPSSLRPVPRYGVKRRRFRRQLSAREAEDLLVTEAVPERLLVRLLGRLAHGAIERLGVCADEDAPAPVPHAVEDHGRGFG